MHLYRARNKTVLVSSSAVNRQLMSIWNIQLHKKLMNKYINKNLLPVTPNDYSRLHRYVDIRNWGGRRGFHFGDFEFQNDVIKLRHGESPTSCSHPSLKFCEKQHGYHQKQRPQSQWNRQHVWPRRFVYDSFGEARSLLKILNISFGRRSLV